MISGVHHVGFSTPDIERLIAFYRDVVGFEVALRIEHGTPSDQLDRMVEMDGVTSRMALLRAGNVFLELIQFNSPPGRPRPDDWKIADHGIGHIGLLVDDIDAEYARLSAAGMHFHAPPVHNEGRPTAACWGRDPDGNRVEIIEVRDASSPHALPDAIIAHFRARADCQGG
jgi:catechol 2,3-dioxygenase-like lactoylglutathione lyase family enzyme